MSRDMNLRVNEGVKQTHFNVTDAGWTLVSKWNKVDREYFGINIKGIDSNTRVLLTTDTSLDENTAYEINQGFLATSEFLFLRSDFYVKVATGGVATDIAVWESKKN